MASVQPRGDKWQIRVRHAQLARPFFATFNSEAEARTYAAQLEALLDRGIVPAELMEPEKRGENPQLVKVIGDYKLQAQIAATDKPTLELVAADVGGVRLLSVNAKWADEWVGRLKVERHLAPSTVRKRVECLARVLDWYWRRLTTAGGTAPANPLRMMPTGYSHATDDEARKLREKKLDVKRDVERDRRLVGDEEARCQRVMAGEKRADRERALSVDPAFSLLFYLIVNTGLRLTEALQLRVDQFDAERWVFRVAGSKGHRGKIKPRVVPIVKPLRAPLTEWCADRVGLMFPFWDGTPEDKRPASSRVSARFARVFEYAMVDDFTEHDLRHEATCRWFELRDAAGRWLFSEVEVCKIMGWADTRMAVRYASLRGEDLSARLA